MAIQSYSTDTPRIGKMKGMILAHAEAKERLSKTGRQVQMPMHLLQWTQSLPLISS